MKRYIRTKDGKIINCEQHCCLLGVITTDEIIKQSNNIFDLIEVGDLIVATMYECCDDYYSQTKHLAKVTGINVYYYPFDCGLSHVRAKDVKTISKIYTKQGDNYILVWDKKKGVI